MKKLIILISVLLGFLTTFSCEDDEIVKEPETFRNDLINQFIYSRDFKSLFYENTIFNSFGTVNFNKSLVETIVVDNKEYYILNIAICDDENIVGQVIGIQLSNCSQKLNTGHTYGMIFRDLRDFSLDSKSGIVLDYDLNYDSYNCGYMIIEDNYIIDIKSFDMPYHIEEKYSFKRMTYSKSVHPCDGNGNGDISFGECYSCLKEAIDSHGDTEFLCDAMDVLFMCSSAVAASCLIISSTR